MTPSFSPSPALPILRSSTHVLSNEKDDLPSTSSFYRSCFHRGSLLFLFTTDGSRFNKVFLVAAFISRRCGCDVTSVGLLYVLRNSDQVDRGENTENFYLSQGRQAARSKHEEKRPENSDGRKGAA
ncbi:Uncharacterized protein DBV15_05767 [Temnothorax longispinosus]|uniref:Uncharacterized protein n=1 Tax=Temnothorax longispinosus TaxID=300112 RepID=A0A4V3SA84_9HYME|nr:Uncharacterized protein DBV15_05767 [Temnothorax longispinosus]